MMHPGVIVGRAYPEPIVGRPIDFAVPAGQTVAELVAAVPLRPEHEALRDRLIVRIDGEMVPAEVWHARRIEPAGDRPMRIAVGMPLTGKGGRKILMILAALALAVVGAWVASGGIASAMGLGATSAFAQGGWAAQALSAGIAMAGSMALQALQPKPKMPSSDADRLGQAQAGNAFRRGGSLQRLVGRTAVEPRMVLPPWTDIQSGVKMANGKYRYSQFVSVLMALAGETEIERIEVDGIDTTDMLDVETEVVTHRRGGAKLSKVTSTPIETQVGVELSTWAVDPDDEAGERQQIAGTEAESSPTWHRVESRDGPSDFRIEFILPRGLSYSGDVNTYAACVSLRIRMRRRGPSSWGSWVQLPELLIRGKELHSQLRLHLVVHWVDKLPASAGNRWPPQARAWDRVRGWARVFTHAAWTSPLLTPVASGGYAEWRWDQQVIDVYLLKSSYPLGRYQFDVKRSWPIVADNYDTDTDSLSGSGLSAPTQDFHSVPTLGSDTDKLIWSPRRAQDAVGITTVRSDYPDYPVSEATDRVLTLIWLRARDRQVGRIRVIGTGKVRHWTGGAWTSSRVASSNPADHYRDVLSGPHNASAIADTRADLTTLQDWAEWCDANGHTVGFVAADGSVDEALADIAIAGRASPGRGPLETVVIDRARTGPVGVISARTSWAHSIDMPFREVPHALRVTYFDAVDDFAERTVTVYAPGYGGREGPGIKAATRFEGITYRSITSADKAILRGQNDLLWLLHRSRLMSCILPLEYLDYRRGDRVIFETDLLGLRGASGIVIAVLRNDLDYVDGLVIDKDVSYGEEDGSTLATVGDLSALGDLSAPAVTLGVAIRRTDGVVVTCRTRKITPASAAGWPAEQVIAIWPPIPMPTAGGDDLIQEGALAVTGQIQTIARDAIVWMIEPQAGMTASVTLVDYAGAAFYGE